MYLRAEYPLARNTMCHRICERLSFPIPLRGQNGRILRHSHAMSGSAGLFQERIDILITHGPPFGILNAGSRAQEHQGDPELVDAVNRGQAEVACCWPHPWRVWNHDNRTHEVRERCPFRRIRRSGKAPGRSWNSTQCEIGRGVHEEQERHAGSGRSPHSEGVSAPVQKSP